MQLHLELDPTRPLVRQLIDSLRQAILDGRLRAGARLPATRELARDLRISRNSALAAYAQLTAEGYIEGRVGSGSRVAVGARGAPARSPHERPPERLSAYAQRIAGMLPRLRESRRSCRYDLRYGVPPVAPTLHAAWRHALREAVDDTSFDYPPVAGLPALRTALQQYLARRRGLNVDADDILVVTGIQQGIDLAARVLLDPGDVAVVEEPCYHGLRDAFAAHGARVRGVPVDAHGLDCARLPARGARLLAVTPSHQFPTGAVLSLPRRLALLEYAARHDAFVIEDDYDGEYRHGGRPLAALQSLDRDGRVLYVGSFSRILFPALRLGYMVLPRALREPLRAARWLADRGSAALEQEALARLIASGRLERQLLRNGRALDQRRTALAAALRTAFGADAVLTGGEAGMHLRLLLPWLPATRTAPIVAAAAHADVGVYAVDDYYFESRPPCVELLLGYAHHDPAELREAVTRLARVVAAA